jgi:predicted DNA-binding transcriptional regulator AlpA
VSTNVYDIKPRVLGTSSEAESSPTRVEPAKDFPVELLSRRDLAAIGISYSNVHLLKLESEGKFPRRVTLSPAKVAWLRNEVAAWIEAKAAERS